MEAEDRRNAALEPDSEDGKDIVLEVDAESGANQDSDSGKSPEQESISDPGEEEEPRKKTLEELELENQRLREEHELLLKEYKASLPLKERMYDRVPLTVRQLDVIIGFLLAALVAVIVLGLVDR